MTTTATPLPSGTVHPAVAGTLAKFATPKPAAAPATTGGFVPETGTPRHTATSIPTGLPTQQSSMLHDLASLSLGFANPVAPGQVTSQQQQVLSAWRENASSDYSQYMAAHGFAAIANNPDALFNEEELVAQSSWSMMDTKGALEALNVSAKDYDAWMKLEAEKKKEKGALIGKVVGIAGAIVGFYFGGPAGAAAGYSIGSAAGGAIGGAM